MELALDVRLRFDFKVVVHWTSRLSFEVVRKLRGDIEAFTMKTIIMVSLRAYFPGPLKLTERQEIHFDASNKNVSYRKCLEDEHEGVLRDWSPNPLHMMHYLLNLHEDGAAVNSHAADLAFRAYRDA